MQPDSESDAGNPPSGGAALLGSRPVFEIGDYQDLGDKLWGAYGARLNGSERRQAPFVARANRAEIAEVVLHYCRYDTSVDIAFSHRAGIRQMLCLTGFGALTAGSRTLAITPRFTSLLEVDATFEATYRDGYQQLVLEFDPAGLARTAEAVLETAKLDFHFLEQLPVEDRLRSREIALTLGRLLGPRDAPSDIVVHELAQALKSAFLIENLPGYSDALAARTPEASRTLAARLEDYIQANWKRPLGVEDIAAACGVSVRSVFARFKRDRGVTPAAYVREVRLTHARRMLEAGEGSVMDVVLACGFAGVGHFAKRYRERFGELPSTTAARARRRL